MSPSVKVRESGFVAQGLHGFVGVEDETGELSDEVGHEPVRQEAHLFPELRGQLVVVVPLNVSSTRRFITKYRNLYTRHVIINTMPLTC